MIPKTIDEVTVDWLSAVLNDTIESVEIAQIGQGVGLMGDIFRVTLQRANSESAGPASVVVKLPSSFEDNRAQGVALGMFEAEVRFYKSLATQVSVGLPAIYLAEIIEGTADFVIVMEDLSRLTLVSQTDGMTLDQTFAAVSVLATIHAVWWDRAKAPEYEWILAMTGPRIEYVDQLLVQILPAFLEGFGHCLPEGGDVLYTLFAGNYLKFNATLAARSPWTIAHQDYRVENLMFGPEGSGEVMVIDWQGIGRGPGAYDLAYLLGGSMDVQLRRDNERDLVKAYHDQLVLSGITGYSFEQAFEDYGFAHLMGGLATAMVTGGTMDLSNDRGKQLVETMASRHVTAALDHDGLARAKAVLSAGLEAFSAGLEAFSAGLEAFSAGLEAFSAGLEAFSAGLEAFSAGLEAFSAGLEALSAGLEAFSAGLEAFSAGLEAFSAGLEAFSAGLEAFSAGLEALSAGLEAFSAPLGQSHYGDKTI